MPLHPLLVHLPLVLAFILPVAIATAYFSIRDEGAAPRKVWIAILLLCCLLTVSSFIAMHFGEETEERVERVVSEQIIEGHAEWGELFTWMTLVPLALAFLLLVRRHPALKAMLFAASLVPLALSIPTGHSGAELVYVHNAGSAYGSSGATLHQRQNKNGHTDDD